MKTRPKQPRPTEAIKRIQVIWAIQAFALIITSQLMRGAEIANLGTAILAAAVIIILNTLLWPLLSYILVPFPC